MNTKQYVKKFTILFLALLIISCSKSDDSIRVYTTARKVVKTQINNRQDSLASVRRSYGWKAPSEWNELEGDSIRVGSFSAKGPKGNLEQLADISLVVLGGRGGGLVMNINRWRGQLGLKSITLNEIKKSFVQEEGRLGEFGLYYLKNSKTGQGILASIFNIKEKTIFVKMKGTLETLEYQKQNFLKFSKGIYEN